MKFFEKTVALLTVSIFIVYVLGISELNAYSKTQPILIPAGENESIAYLGEKFDHKSGKIIEGYAIIHYKAGHSKPNPQGKSPKPIQCYSFLASGAKWKSLEPWLINPANTRNLDYNSLFDNLGYNITKWEDASDGIVGNGLGIDILGNGSATLDPLLADLTSPDNQNEVYFGDVANQGAIAVTIVWGIFGGNPSQRELIEWDQIYDDIDYDWSLSGEAGKMDFENIATHELGHSAGMADLYNSNCAVETMYGYADYGEINKRDLNNGDIAGINKLY